jgi:peptidyl-prolyl cis-trans isomerase B (cyclophilin B)
MRRLTALLIACLAVLVTACGGGDEKPAAAPGTTPTAPASAQDAGCRTVDAPGPKQVDAKKPSQPLSGGQTYVVTLKTNCGDIAIELDTKRQPKTAASFAGLVRDRVYDGLSFHRVVPGFVIQGGDPRGDGTGGPGYSVVEKPPAGAAYTRGVVAMAKTEIERAGTSGSQFFIVTAEDAKLPPDYAIVGKVVGGDDTVDRIAAVPTSSTDAPQSPVVIESATLEPQG